MYIDKELYRKAYEQYEQWNEADFAHRVRNAGKLSPEEAWRQYIALVDLSSKRHPSRSKWQREQKQTALNRYYERVRQLEEWRQKNGKRN